MSPRLPLLWLCALCWVAPALPAHAQTGPPSSPSNDAPDTNALPPAKAVVLVPRFQVEAEQGSNRVARATRADETLNAIAAAIDDNPKFSALYGPELDRRAAKANINDPDAYCRTRTSTTMEYTLGADFILCTELVALSPQQGHRLRLSVYSGQIRMNTLVEVVYIDNYSNPKAYTDQVQSATARLLARITPAPLPILGAQTPSTPSPKLPAGQLIVTAQPSAALVRLTGQPVGVTPYKLEVSPGEYIVVVEHPGFEETVHKATVTPDGIATIDTALVPRGVRLSLETTPPGATVYANGQPVGVTPIDNHSVPASNGRLDLMIVKEGFVTKRLSTPVQTGDRVVDRIDLQPLSSMVAVQTYKPDEVLILDGQRRFRVPDAGITELHGLETGPHTLRTLPRRDRPEIILHFNVPHPNILHVTPLRTQADMAPLTVAEPAIALSDGSYEALGAAATAPPPPALGFLAGAGLLRALDSDHLGGFVGLDYALQTTDHRELRLDAQLSLFAGQQPYRLTDTLTTGQLIRPQLGLSHTWLLSSLLLALDASVGALFPAHALVLSAGSSVGLRLSDDYDLTARAGLAPMIFGDQPAWDAWTTTLGLRRRF